MKLKTLNNFEYDVSEGLNYSTLKALDELGPSVLVEGLFDKKTTALSFGGLVDDLITDPKAIKSSYYISSAVSPGGQLEELAKAYVNNSAIAGDNNLALYLADELGLFKSSKKPETRVKQFDKPEFWDYVRELIEGAGKLVVSEVDYNKATYIKHVLFNHPATKDIFNSKNVVFQMAFEYELEGLKFKSKLDLVVLDKEAKTARIYDLKTGAPKVSEFEKNFYKYKYYLQGALYYRGLQILLEKYGYEVLPVVDFIYVCKSDVDNPFLWTMDEEWLQMGLNGWTTNTGREYNGIYNLIDDYKWYKENNVFNVRRELATGRKTIKHPIVMNGG